MEHSLATDQGTDWRDNDPDLEPLVEIYQGYHAAYEYAGGPRAESDNYHVKIHGPYRPLGFWWNALDKGLLLGVQASSDHISTHVSYALLLTPQVDRATIVDNMRQRHAYAATSNIVLDFEAEESDGTRHLQGEWIQKAGPIRLTAKIMGTDLIQRVEVIRNGKFVYSQEPNAKDYNLEYSDQAPPVRPRLLLCACPATGPQPGLEFPDLGRAAVESSYGDNYRATDDRCGVQQTTRR